MSQDKILNLIERIFRYFEDKESLILDYSFIYYTHNKFDSNNATYFENMSNCNLIGIKSKLEKDDISILMNLFQAIIDENFWRFEDIDESILIGLEKEDINIIKDDLSSYDDLEKWIKILSYHYNDFYHSEEIPIAQRDYLLLDDKNMLTYPDLENFKQKYFTLNELNSKIRFR